MARPNGQIRRGQIINVFGPGALMDLPHHAAIVGGLDTWDWGGDDRKRKIIEPRLLSKIEAALERQGLAMWEPPADSQDPDAPPSGGVVYRFPEWFRRVRTGISPTSIGTPSCMAWPLRGQNRAVAISSWMSGAPAATSPKW